MSSKRLLRLSNLSVESGTVGEVADRIVERAEDGIGSRLVLPVNAQVFVLGTQNPTFANVLLSAPKVVADGASVTFAMWMLRSGNARRIAGVDLMLALCERAAQNRLRVMLIGGRQGSAKSTAAILEQRYPGSHRRQSVDSLLELRRGQVEKPVHGKQPTAVRPQQLRLKRYWNEDPAE